MALSWQSACAEYALKRRSQINYSFRANVGSCFADNSERVPESGNLTPAVGFFFSGHVMIYAAAWWARALIRKNKRAPLRILLSFFSFHPSEQTPPSALFTHCCSVVCVYQLKQHQWPNSRPCTLNLQTDLPKKLMQNVRAIMANAELRYLKIAKRHTSSENIALHLSKKKLPAQYRFCYYVWLSAMATIKNWVFCSYLIIGFSYSV